MALSCSKSIPALLRRTTSKHDDEFYCLKCLHSFRKEKKFVKIKIFVEL